MRIRLRRTLVCSLVALGSVAGLAGCSTSDEMPVDASAPTTPSASTGDVDIDAAIEAASEDALAAASDAIAACADGAYGNCDVWAWTIAHHTIERWDVGEPALTEPGQVVEYDEPVAGDPIATVCQTYEATGTGSAVAVDAAPASEGDVRIGTGVIVAVEADGSTFVEATHRCGP